MKNALFVLACFPVFAFAQVQKDQWLVGGSALFSYSKSKELQYFSTQLAPAAGYFFKDKFAGGIRFSLSSDTHKYGSDKFRNSTIAASPFIRYYFLPKEKKVNVLVDASFGYSWTKYRSFTFPSSYEYDSYSLGVIAGPAIFLNERTALEITLGYSYLSRGPSDSTITNKVQIGAGLQIHLGKQ